jgi:hypothetical protein
VTYASDEESVSASGRVARRFYYSRRFLFRGTYDAAEEHRIGQPTRFAYQVIDPDDGVSLDLDNGQVVIIRQTPGRQQIKALFFESDRYVHQLLLQRFNKDGKPLQNAFSLRGDEIATLRQFLELIDVVDLASSEGSRLDERTMREALRSPEAAKAVYEAQREEIYALIRDDVTAQDVYAVQKRRESLQEFDRLLTDQDHFAVTRISLGQNKRPEDVWQHFFNENRWIFGFGFAVQVLLPWDDRNIEQTIVGSSIRSGGKMVDGLLRSAGALSSICLVEIKRHDTPLIGREPRTDAFAQTRELSDAIAQCHANADALVRDYRSISSRDEDGFTTGDMAYVVRPRSYLVAGSLTEFQRQGGIHEQRFRSFETLRRSLVEPEIITFDELYERSRLTVVGL